MEKETIILVAAATTIAVVCSLGGYFFGKRKANPKEQVTEATAETASATE